MEFSKSDLQEKKEVFHFRLDSVKAVDFSPMAGCFLAGNYSQVFILDRISGEPCAMSHISITHSQIKYLFSIRSRHPHTNPKLLGFWISKPVTRCAGSILV